MRLLHFARVRTSCAAGRRWLAHAGELYAAAQLACRRLGLWRTRSSSLTQIRAARFPLRSSVRQRLWEASAAHLLISPLTLLRILAVHFPLCLQAMERFGLHVSGETAGMGGIPLDVRAWLLSTYRHYDALYACCDFVICRVASCSEAQHSAACGNIQSAAVGAMVSKGAEQCPLQEYCEVHSVYLKFKVQRGASQCDAERHRLQLLQYPFVGRWCMQY